MTRPQSRTAARRSPAWFLAAALAAALMGPPRAAGRDLFVSPEGKPGAPGTKDSPLDLASAISDRSPAAPGDTIWVMGGTYHPPFACKVAGKPDAPVTIRAVPGQRATLDCRLPAGSSASPYLSVQGGDVAIWGLEVTCSDAKRKTAQGGSSPSDIRRGSVNGYASRVRFINMIVHDCDQGFGFWSSGEGGEIYGCIIYNNGWIGPDRGHGHAIYAQNKDGTKQLADNVMFNQFSYGIHVYGSGRAFLKGFHVEGNVSFNNGSGADPDSRTPAMLIGGGSPAERITVLGNCTFGDRHGGGDIRLGYTARSNVDVQVHDNYVVGAVDLVRWERAMVHQNTILSPGTMLRLEYPKDAAAKYEIARNAYVRMGGKQAAPFAIAGEAKAGGRTFAEWQKEGFDADSQCAEGKPSAVKVFVRPNRYEPGRAHIVVYNWDLAKEVEVDLGSLLKPGQKYRIVSAQDFYGKPIIEGRFQQPKVRLPMTEYRAVPPVGMDGHNTPITGPLFNVFVVLPEVGAYM